MEYFSFGDLLMKKFLQNRESEDADLRIRNLKKRSCAELRISTITRVAVDDGSKSAKIRKSLLRVLMLIAKVQKLEILPGGNFLIDTRK